MEHLTEDQLEQIKEVFAKYDTDGDGFVYIDNLGTMLRMLSLNPTNKQISDVKKQAAAIGRENRIDFPELLDLVAHNFCLGDSLETKLMAAFRVFDTSGRGCISLNELRYALTTLGEILAPVQVDRVLQDFGLDTESNPNPDLEYAPLIKHISRLTL